jgi:cytochrome c
MLIIGHSQILFKSILICFAAIVSSCWQMQDNKEKPSKTIDYIKAIPGESDTLSIQEIQKGEVLIAYSDCYTCHTVDKRSKGPAFKDIAQRYPVQDIYINYLAQKIITGGFGAWGRPVMDPHPNLSEKDARLMVIYILSLK